MDSYSESEGEKLGVEDPLDMRTPISRDVLFTSKEWVG
jgi:hypothetical protein